MLGLRCPKASVGFALLAQEASAILFDYVVLFSFFFSCPSVLSTLPVIVSFFDGQQSRPTKTPLSHITAVDKDNN